jgi:FkbM family methyltransferase
MLPMRKWTERAALMWGFRYQPPPRVVSLRSGASIYVEGTDYIQLMIYYFGAFEPHCLEYLRRCATKGGTVVDVGANIGIFTLESSLAVGPAGRVLSIEAAPENAWALRANVQRNEFSNVSIIEAGAGDAKGQATLTLPSGSNVGMFTLGSVAGSKSFDIQIDTIDHLLEPLGITSIDLLKMDIEGSETRALRGAQRTLQQFRPTVLIELNETALAGCGSSSREVKALLGDLGYRGWIIGRSGLHAIADSQAAHACDECLFVHRDNAGVMQHLGLR